MHEKFDEICIRIPILALGPKVKQGYAITGYSSITDIAPTALNALGMHPGKYMVGKVLDEIYIPGIVHFCAMSVLNFPLNG